MLQQTTTAHASPYFHTFMERWPTVEALAAAEDAEVMQAWAGLGYYARARNMLACARQVSARGGFPNNAVALRALPGVGAYTSAAIASIAFGEAICPVDGNVERVIARLFALSGEWKAARLEIDRLAQTLVPPAVPGQNRSRAGDFAQALMDLGATICTPRRPSCLLCPLATQCKAQALGTPKAFPQKPARADQPLRFGATAIVTAPQGLLRVTRPSKGLLGGMAGLPTSVWDKADGQHLAQLATLLAAEPQQLTPIGTISHVFTHFRLSLSVHQLSLDHEAAQTLVRYIGGHWVEAVRAQDGLPTAFAKAVRLFGAAAAQKAG